MSRKSENCETRWIERIESIADFSSSLEAIIDILDQISEWDDATTSSKASSLTTCLAKFEFWISLHCKVSVLHLFLLLSNIFQKTSPIWFKPDIWINNLIVTLKHMRANCDSEFSVIFQNVESLSKTLRIEIT
jgi:hypothetical protein